MTRNTTDNEPGEAISEVAQCAQAVLTALNVGDIQSGSPLHLKLREVMIAYRERAARAPVAAPQPPMCAVHAALDGKDNLTLEVGNGCIACSLHERTELLNVLEPFASPDGTQDSVTVLRNAIARATPPPTTPSAAAMRAAEELQRENLLLADATLEELSEVAAIITRHLAGTTAPDETAVGGEARKRFVDEFTQATIEAHVGFHHEKPYHECDYAVCVKRREMINGFHAPAPVPAAGDDVGEQPIAQLIAKEIADIYGLGHQRSGLTTVISKYLVAVSTSTPILQPDELNDLCETLEMAAADLDTEGLGDTDSCIFARKWAARLRGERQ